MTLRSVAQPLNINLLFRVEDLKRIQSFFLFTVNSPSVCLRKIVEIDLFCSCICTFEISFCMVSLFDFKIDYSAFWVWFIGIPSRFVLAHDRKLVVIYVYNY